MSIETSNSSANRSPASRPATRKSWFPVVGLLVVAVSTLLQMGCLANAFVIDDNTLVFDADDRGCGANPADCFHGKLFHLYYRPVLTASFALVQKIHMHTNVAKWFHLENLLLHAAVCALAFWLFRLLLKSRTAASVAGALFAFHPVQVDVTTFIGGRTDNLALLFMFTYAIGLIRGSALLRTAQRKRIHKVYGVALIGLSVIAFLAAIFTKEQVAPLILLSPLIAAPRIPALVCRSGKRAAAWLWQTIYLIPVAIFVGASRSVLKGDHLPEAGWPLMLHIEMVGRTIWYFVKMLLFPTVTTMHQSTLGPWDVKQQIVEILGFMSAIGWGAICYLTWRNSRTRLLTLWVTLSLISCLNLVPIPSQFASPYRAAIPSFGLAGLAGLAVVKLTSIRKQRLRRWLGPMITTAFAGSISWYSITTVVDVPKWKDELSLMRAEVAADPNYIEARAALANYIGEPPDGSRGDLQASLAEYNRCLTQLFGPNVTANELVGLIRTKDAERKLHSAGGLRWNPRTYIPQMIRGRGSVSMFLEKYDDAIADYVAVLALMPNDDWTQTRLCWCYKVVGDRAWEERNYDEAAENYRNALMVNSEDKMARSALILAYRIQGKKAQAAAVERMEDRLTGKVP